MKTETKVLGLILVLTAALLFGGIFLLSRFAGSNTKDSNILQIDYTKGQKIGSSSAKIKLVEFSDFQCPACKTAEPAIKGVLLAYSDKVQFIYRHFPLPQHANAQKAATLAEAAGQEGKFWEMADRLFETQTEWSGLSDATPFFLDLAKQLGLDESNVKKVLDENSFKSKIDDDVADGRNLGVSSTPTFFLNGRKLNLKTFNDLNTAVAEEINK